MTSALRSVPPATWSFIGDLPSYYRPRDWPVCSSGEVFLLEALEVAGKARLGEEWTGRELECLAWPHSPVEEVEAARAKSEQTLQRIQAGGKAAGFPTNSNAPTLKLYSDHVRAWHSRQVDKLASLHQSRWEENERMMARARATASWLHDRFRDGDILTKTRFVSGSVEPLPMPPSEWFREGLLDTWFRTGSYDRIFLTHPNTPLPVYIFVDKESLDRAISTLPHASAVISGSDISVCSPDLRFAVAFTAKYAKEWSDWTRPALEAQLIQDWAKAHSGAKLGPTQATRLGFVIWPPAPEASAEGGKGAASKKKG